MTKEPTNTEILTFLRDNVATKEDLCALGERLDARIDSLESRIDSVESRMATKEDLHELESRMASKEDLHELESRMASKEDLRELESRMATKDDLKVLDHGLKNFTGDRLADLEGSLVARQRKHDNKMNKLLDVMEEHALLPKEDIARVRGVQVFSAH